MDDRPAPIEDLRQQVRVSASVQPSLESHVVFSNKKVVIDSLKMNPE
jgi:hypothetical protein